MSHNSLSFTSTGMSQKTFCSNESDIEPLDLTIKRSEAENKEIINEKFQSDLDKKHSTGSTITEDKQSNFELPNASYNDSLICSICKKEFEEHAVLYEGKNVHKCCFCEYQSDAKWGVMRHISRHGPEPFSCKMCGEMFKERNSHDTKQICNVCGETFQCRTLLLEHSFFHSSHCIMCWRGMGQHEIPEYAERIQYKCCECEHETNDKAKLRSHFYTHFKEKAFRCVECGKRYSRERALFSHITRKHRGKLLLL